MTDNKQKDKTGWNFDNSYAGLPNSLYTILNPTPVRSPDLVILNKPLAASLGLNIVELLSKDGVAVFAGNKLAEGSVPLAQAYAGHQFGYLNLLGDGRALLLGEQITPAGDRFDIQLKGSGKTPYSRRGDGRASLGPMLREYIISEGMHGLGIPTTRSLAVVTTGEPIYRQTEEKGAILTRVASSHLRVGTFQYVAKWGTREELKVLADYTLQRHFSDIITTENRYLQLLREVIKRQASLIAKWQLVGFVHGVMNTDNMTISGETIDYGPCAFMDTYDLATVFSSIDTHGRYAYGSQPRIGTWNLARFAETLLSLLHEDQPQAIALAEKALSEYGNLYYSNWLKGMRAKLGIFDEEEKDQFLIENLLKLMEEHRLDYTNTFLDLTFARLESDEVYETTQFKSWYDNWQQRLDRQQQSNEESQQLMRDSNPALIPRNHRVEEALEAAVEKGDLRVMERFLNALANPYAHSTDQLEYCTLPPEGSLPYKTYCGT